MDLTNVPPKEMPLRHYADSLVPLKHAEWFAEGSSMIDVGSGAGFPGMAIGIMRPDMEILLLDSLNKRYFMREQRMLPEADGGTALILR